MKGLFKGIFFLLIILLIALTLGRNIIFKAGIEQGVKAITGLPLEMAALDINLTETFVNIQDLKLYNPAGFSDPVMVDIPEIHVDYDLGALMKKKIHLKEMRLRLKDFYVVTNEDGALNLDTLKALQKPSAKEADEKPPAPKDEAPLPEIQIDLLKLQVGQVIFKDYSKGGEPKVREFQIGLDEEIRDIDDPNALVQAIVFRALLKTPIANLTNFDISGLGDMVSGTLGTVTGKVTDVTQGAVDKAEEALKTTAEGVKDIIKLPFGNP